MIIINDYILSPMEELAVRHLEALGITKPSEIDINVLTNKANIDFNYGLFSCYGEQENYKMILIDESVNELRELQIHFLHEYAHFLLGHEEKLSDAISGHIHQENEREARELAMCLAIPNHMMGEFYAHDEYLAFTLSEDFNVPLYIAKERIEYMNQRAIMYRD